MKQIASFMSEISDEFKTIVVQAIQSVCIKFPRKHHILMTFLSSMLREEGGADYKKAIVNTIITIIEENQDAKEAGGWGQWVWSMHVLTQHVLDSLPIPSLYAHVRRSLSLV